MLKKSIRPIIITAIYNSKMDAQVYMVLCDEEKMDFVER